MCLAMFLSVFIKQKKKKQKNDSNTNKFFMVAIFSVQLSSLISLAQLMGVIVTDKWLPTLKTS